MSDRKYGLGVLKFISFMTLICSTLIISGCSRIFVPEYSVSDAVTAGVLIAMPEVTQADVNNSPDFIYPEIKPLTRTSSFVPMMQFAREAALTFTQSEFSEQVFNFDTGNAMGISVEKGQVLTYINFEVSERYIILYEAAVAQLRLFEAGYSSERENMANAINSAGAQMRQLTGDDARRAALNIRQMEINLERFIISSESTRMALTEEVETFRAKIGREEITAPFDGGITHFQHAGLTQTVWDAASAGFIIAPAPTVWMADSSKFMFSLAINKAPPTNAIYNILGIGDIVTFQSHMGPELTFQGRVVSDTWASPEDRARWTNWYVYWIEPIITDELVGQLREISDLPIPFALNSLNFTVSIEEVVAPVGLTLPVFAIHRAGVSNFVYVYDNGHISMRNVQVGVQVGTSVEIILGIDENTRVVVLP